MLYPLLFLASLAASVPLPQLTLDQFQARGRSLEAPQVFVSQPYASVRRQGRMGGSQDIKFPTLLVRDPNELTFASPIQKTAFATGPVYTGSNELSTKDIEEKIKQINAAEFIVEEEQVLESLLEEELEQEIDELTDLAAAEIAAEEIAEEIVEEEMDELLNLAAAEIVAEELAEDIVEAELDNLIPDFELSELEIDSLNVSDETSEPRIIIDIEDPNEGSGSFAAIDFGDIMEIVTA
eukprot:GFUD01043609.1.p1 GENE.GFUD01043609.1~~GFUD01043609.1.p1  ORF type:complete len:238 (+),score=100.83 GFUD01043609.1:31-744(+)